MKIDVKTIVGLSLAATWEQKQSSTDSNAIVNYIPDKYYTQVMYKGERFTVADEVTFNRFCDRIGERARAYMDITEYDDGRKSYDIISVF